MGDPDGGSERDSEIDGEKTPQGREMDIQTGELKERRRK